MLFTHLHFGQNQLNSFLCQPEPEFQQVVCFNIKAGNISTGRFQKKWDMEKWHI
jgi:hypothetical protein